RSRCKRPFLLLSSALTPPRHGHEAAPSSLWLRPHLPPHSYPSRVRRSSCYSTSPPPLFRRQSTAKRVKALVSRSRGRAAEPCPPRGGKPLRLGRILRTGLRKPSLNFLQMGVDGP